MSCQDSGVHLHHGDVRGSSVHQVWVGCASSCVRTCILIIELQKVALLVQLVGVAVEKGEDGLQLRNGILADVHEGRLEGLHY